TWDGKVVPCCFDKDAEYRLGDSQHESFQALWHGRWLIATFACLGVPLEALREEPTPTVTLVVEEPAPPALRSDAAQLQLLNLSALGFLVFPFLNLLAGGAHLPGKAAGLIPRGTGAHLCAQCRRGLLLCPPASAGQPRRIPVAALTSHSCKNLLVR
nr:hypothetical protein [Tanacetum cinerariifolium]